MKRGFGSDNHSGVSPEILEALSAANTGHALAYGDDEWSAAVSDVFKRHFGRQAEVYFVFNGTGANVLSIDLMCRSHHAVVCAETAHIFVDECGAPQRIVGSKLLPVKTADGKLTTELALSQMHGFGFEHHAQPKAISISQPTELGTLYTIEEIESLARLAHSHGMYLHVDGARLANAAVSLGCSFKSMTTDAGVDILSFGGTKNGMLMGESCVVLNPKLNDDAKYRRKQMAQLCSKMRFIAVQFDAYLNQGLWRRNAEHSNQMAQLLYAELMKIGEFGNNASDASDKCGSMQDRPDEYRVLYPVQANSVFVRLPRRVWKALQEQYFFYDWNEADNEVRWMCSFDTTEDDIRDFVSTLRHSMDNCK